MKLFSYIAALITCLALLASCQSQSHKQIQPLLINQAKLNELASTLKVQYKFLSNIENSNQAYFSDKNRNIYFSVYTARLNDVLNELIYSHNGHN